MEKTAIESLPEFKVVWAQCPTYYNPERCLFVRAQTASDAKKIAVDYIQRTFGLNENYFLIFDVQEVQPLPIGYVVK